MKKIILLILSIFLILTGCSNSGVNKSLNGLLEYKLPENWQDMEDYQGVTELCIEKNDKSTGIMAEYIEYEFSTAEDFIQYQDENLKLEADFLEDRNFEENGKNITSKIYETENELGNVQFVAGTVEFTDKSAFIGFIGTAIDNENGIDEIYTALKSINLTEVDLNQERTIVAEKEYIEITLPPRWKRFERSAETSFYRSEGIEFLYTYANTLSKEDANPQEEFDKMCEQFKLNFLDSKVYSETKVEDLEDRIITSIVYGFEEEDGEGMYVSISVIEFKNSDLFVLQSYDIIVDGTFEDIKEEIEKITKSIKIKKGAEKQFKKDKEKSTEIQTDILEDFGFDEDLHYEGDGHIHEDG
ncbi:MAG: hypothetical protein K2F59_06170, partial [Eubacteriales bacterium]|nr:hypothetical protein [Eubacteriales bacterium]